MAQWNPSLYSFPSLAALSFCVWVNFGFGRVPDEDGEDTGDHGGDEHGVAEGTPKPKLGRHPRRRNLKKGGIAPGVYIIQSTIWWLPAK